MGDIHVPILGNSWTIGLFALLHFALVSMGGLAGLVIYLAEGRALKRNDGNLRRMAKDFLTLALEIAVIGGILGSGVVVAVLVLRPTVMNIVVNTFFWFLVLQLFAFIIGLGFLFAYYFTWDKTPSRHRLWGLIGAILLLVPYVVFSAGAAFLNNPGSWPETGNVWAAVFNPITVPSLLHRAAAGLALIGMFIAAVHLIGRRNKSGEERAYHDYAIGWGAKLTIYALMAQIVLGIIRIFVVRPEGQKLIMGGPLTLTWMIGIVAGLVALVALTLVRRRDGPLSGAAVVFLGLVPVLAAVWFMGSTRAQERDDFSIVGVITREDEIVQLPPSYAAAAMPSGETVYQANCGACHPGAAGDAIALSRQRHPDPQNLAGFLRDPSAAGVAMPPFTGSDEELAGLVGYLLDLPADQVTVPAAAAPAEAAPSAAVAAAEPLDLGEFVVLGWNDLGMHCYMADYSVFQVLPPANTLWAQVIERGEKPVIMPAGLTVDYHFPEISDPVPNTNFWDYAPAYGWDLEPGVGLAGNKVAGEMENKGDHFVAELVPIVDTMDNGMWDPYPMFILDVKDVSGSTLVTTTNVAPVSSEMSCDLCHQGGPANELKVTMENILKLHDENEGTKLLERSQGGEPPLCASCHASPALGIMENNGALSTFSSAMHSFHADKMDPDLVPGNICWTCHPGPRTQCQRGAMSMVGINCLDCHGGMEEVGDANRTSWMNLPTCESCHTNALTRATLTEIPEPNSYLTRSFDTLYRNRTAHGGIYCTACHNSPHALYPSTRDRDNIQSLLWQGETGTIGKNCTVCHTGQPAGEFWHFDSERGTALAD